MTGLTASVVEVVVDCFDLLFCSAVTEHAAVALVVTEGLEALVAVGAVG